MESINKKLDIFSELGSGWVFEKVEEIFVYIGKYKPRRGGNSFGYTPAGLQGKKAIVNVQNKDH